VFAAEEKEGCKQEESYEDKGTKGDADLGAG
jgi:hypothetical protein